MAGTVSLSSAIWEGGMKGLGTGVMGWVLRGVSVERAGLAGMGMLSVGGLVGGSAFAAVCYVSALETMFALRCDAYIEKRH